MPARLSELRKTLVDAIKLSKQASYQRRAPAKESVPLLQALEMDLKEYVKDHPDDPGGWRLLSQVEECLLKYSAAIDSLEKAMALSLTRSRPDLKRLSQLKEYLVDWARLGLTGRQLSELGKFLAQQGADEEPRGRSLQFTEQWLVENSISNPGRVIEALAHRGAFTDFQTLHNVIHG